MQTKFSLKNHATKKLQTFSIQKTKHVYTYILWTNTIDQQFRHAFNFTPGFINKVQLDSWLLAVFAQDQLPNNILASFCPLIK